MVDDSPRFDIRRFVFEGASLVPVARLEELTRPFAGQRRQFGDVQRALEAVERAYSDAGWSAVQVVLPEQELERGEVRFQVIEAKIGRVIVEGNKFFDEANVRASAPALAPGRAPNINEIARNLRIANENPAKQATVLLRSGQEEGTVDAVLRVVDEKPSKRSVTIDNTGSSQTGKYRVGFGFQHSNAFGIDDVLTLQYVTAPYSDHVNSSGEPDHLQPWPSSKIMILGAGYKVPLYRAGDTMDFTFGYSNVNSGTVANLFSITGAGTLVSARYTHYLDKIGDYEHRLALSQDFRTYDNKGVRAVGTTTQLVADVTVHPFNLAYIGLYRQQESESAFSLGFSKNLPGGNDGDRRTFCQTNPVARNNGIGNCARADYEILRWSFNHNRSISGDWQARFAMNGQWTRDMLLTPEQFGIGGADSVRGFLEREISNDAGYRGTFEIYTPDIGGKTGISGARLRGLMFVDWGHVWRNSPGPGEVHAQSVWSLGPGLRFSRGTNMALRLDFAVIEDEAGCAITPCTGTQRVGNSRLHFSFSYIF